MGCKSWATRCNTSCGMDIATDCCTEAVVKEEGAVANACEVEVTTEAKEEEAEGTRRFLENGMLPGLCVCVQHVLCIV
jgi:hypothetical protein